ncbi:CLUMA_CG014959, isoform A [Clunio marinus]|uniref:CLUMA_CG014959, isoform A n=1 Tax=Clunio marinus TaxID=568069 RepID=A0A1J1IND0_9DIPT|nr:CLUMA_CG014959, isoform A [Clunio marinus]
MTMKKQENEGKSFSFSSSIMKISTCLNQMALHKMSAPHHILNEESGLLKTNYKLLKYKKIAKKDSKKNKEIHI